MMSFKTITSMIEGYQSEVAEICSKLVQCHSEHPEGNTDSCVAYIKNYFDERGIPNETYERDKGKPNIVVRVKGTSERKILWVGHNDVVPVGDLDKWTYPPFEGKIADGMVWGRGSSDMKGSNASAMIAALILSEVESPYDVDFWFTSDEEVGGGAGAAWLAKEQIFEGEVAIIGDGCGSTPGLVNVGVGHKGGIGIRLVAEGKTAHGSTPYLGDNAVDKLLQVIPHIKTLSGYELNIPDDLKKIVDSTVEFMLTDKTLNDDQRKAAARLYHYPSGPSLNLFNGGIKGNVVPDHAEAYFDIRLTPGVDALKIKEYVEKMIEDLNIPGVSVQCRASAKVGYYETADNPAVIALSKVVEKVTNERPLLTLAPWGTDAVSIKRNIKSLMYPDGIPNILFGPMLRDQLHQTDEYVPIKNMVTAAKVYSLFPFQYK